MQYSVYREYKVMSILVNRDIIQIIPMSNLA